MIACECEWVHTCMCAWGFNQLCDFGCFVCVLFPKGMNVRNGTDVDAGNAMKVFGKLGYKVKVFNDQTVDQILQALTAGNCT